MTGRPPGERTHTVPPGAFHIFIVTAGREKGKRIGTVIRSMVVIKNNHERAYLCKCNKKEGLKLLKQKIDKG